MNFICTPDSPYSVVLKLLTLIADATFCFADAILSDAVGTTFTDTAGTIQSPNYPMNYQPNTNIWYYIVSQYVSKITINFLDVNLETNFDHLRVSQKAFVFELYIQKLTNLKAFFAAMA
jgi:hypothetical protein